MKKKSKLVIAFAVLIAIVIVVFASTRIIGESAKVYAQHIEVSQKYLDELEYDLAIAELERQ